MRRLLTAPLAVAAVAVVVAGCGGSSKSSSTASQSTSTGAAQSKGGGYGGGYGGGSSQGSGTTPSGSTSAAAIATHRFSVGTALVGPNGRAVYLFEKDKGPASTCSGACAKAWPPLTATSMPKAGAGVDASKLTLIKRADGTQQVAYNGHPLYFFVNDKKAGQDSGEGINAFGADWYVVAPSGSKIDEG